MRCNKLHRHGSLMHGHKVRHTAAVLSSEARDFFAEAVAKGIIASDDNRLLASVGNSSGPAVYAVTDKGEVVGLIAYTVLECGVDAVITLAYVEETSRKLGVFTQLFNELESYLERYGVREIYIDIPATEETLADVIERRGGAISTYRYAIDIGRRGDGHGKLLGKSNEKPEGNSEDIPT
ncbi:N-acyltransferase protein [Rhizobium phage RHph_Y1_11]|nr:N-acyltransferase protein [Rhizobium phage RHph_Y1_11]